MKRPQNKINKIIVRLLHFHASTASLNILKIEFSLLKYIEYLTSLSVPLTVVSQCIFANVMFFRHNINDYKENTDVHIINTTCRTRRQWVRYPIEIIMHAVRTTKITLNVLYSPPYAILNYQK